MDLTDFVVVVDVVVVQNTPPRQLHTREHSREQCKLIHMLAVGRSVVLEYVRSPQICLPFLLYLLPAVAVAFAFVVAAALALIVSWKTNWPRKPARLIVVVVVLETPARLPKRAHKSRVALASSAGQVELEIYSTPGRLLTAAH